MTIEPTSRTMLDDLIERLLNFYGIEGWPLIKEAADEIKRSNQSEREGWRYAGELEEERKRLTAENESLCVKIDHLEDKLYDLQCSISRED